MIDFLDWLARAAGIVALLAALLGYMFKEKWKQLLQRSMSEHLEKLKADLLRQQTEYAHTFQERLEAYKVSLIAQAEAAKAQSELNKSIALKFADIEFSRLVDLESQIAPIASTLTALGSLDIQYKTVHHFTKAVSDIEALGVATNLTDMFMSWEDSMELAVLRRTLVDFSTLHIGPNKISPVTPDKANEIFTLASNVHAKLKDRICKLGKINQNR